MEIRDPVHGSIQISDEMIPVIEDVFFERLRNIKQLGFSEYIFPGATHSRFIHSIGVMSIAEKAFDKLFKKQLKDNNFIRLKETFKLACLLHDIGHAPLSHSTESVMPKLSSLNIDKTLLNNKTNNDHVQATHEDYTVLAITKGVRNLDTITKKFNIERSAICNLITGFSSDPTYFTINGINYFPILHQLVSSEMDCDRMDYLLRDSYFCGVSYGNFDLDWLLDNIKPCIIDNQTFLGITERAVVTFDDFLLSRFHMFLMVYFHYKSVCLEQLLLKYFKTSNNEYTIPSDINKYLAHDDHYLLKILRMSKNRYAKSIIQNKIPTKIFESFNKSDLAILSAIQQYCDQEKIEYIRCSSTGRISKYYSPTYENVETYNIKVVKENNLIKSQTYFDIDKATDLFQKFSKSHAVNRLHVNLNDLSLPQKSHIISIIQNNTTK